MAVRIAMEVSGDHMEGGGGVMEVRWMSGSRVVQVSRDGGMGV